MKPSTLDKEVMKSLSSTYLFIGKGSTSTLKVGRTSQPTHEIVENIVDVTQALTKLLPKKGQNVSPLFPSVNLKTQTTNNKCPRSNL